MNLTLAIEDKTVEEARAVAAQMGTSLNHLVREYLRELAGRSQIEPEIAELRAGAGSGHSQGWVFNRAELQRGT